MFPILYEKNETNFLHNGIGVLSDCISATATEERNGIFELEIEYDSDGQFADVIENDMIIKAKANDKQDPQLFRVYAVNKSQENDNLKISAQHITYDLAGNFVEKLELNNVTAAAAMEAIQNNLAYPTKFTIASTNTATVSSTKLYRTNPLQMIGGIDGSIIDNWGGEIERDNFRLILHAHRGSDNGVLVAYKKNLTGLEAKFDTSEVVTRIFPFKVLEDGTVITIPGKFIDSPLINNYPFIRILPIDASEDEDVTDQASLYAAYKDYFNSGDHDKPMVTLEVEFEPLWATEEYEDVAALELIGMGDTITVRNEKMGVDVTAKATKIEYDVLNEKNAKVTAGSIQTRLTDAVNGATSTVAQGIQQATQTANAALTAANGKNKIFYGPDEPAGANKDDVWFKVVDGEYTRTYRFDGIQWQLVVDADVSAADQAAQAAQAAAEKAKATAANAEAVGQAAQQTAADAEAKGEAAAKAAEEAKDAATKAQADAASAVTSANNAVSTANQATQDAQNAIDKAQDGFDAAQDALSKAGAAVDTANTAKQVASDAATQSSNAWTKAQDAMAEAQKKADATSVYTKTDIDDALKGYATTTTVNTLMGRVDSAETAIQQNTNAIQLKADKSTVDTLTGRVSTAEATLTAQADQIAARITKTDADAKYATQTALTATANSLTSSISAVQTNLDNLQVGGRNLIKDSNNFTNLGRNAGAQYTYKTSVSVQEWGATDATEIHVTGGTGTVKLYKPIVAPSVKDCDYTLSVWCKNIGNYPIVITANAFGVVILANGESKRVVMSGKGNGINNFQLNIGTTEDNINNPIDFVIWRAKGENGNKATDWSPAPEDMATVVQFNTLQQTLDSTTMRIGNAEGNISALQQTANSFATRISNAEENISTLTQTAQGLQTQVNDKVSISQFTQLAGVVDSKVTSSQVNSLIADDKQIKDTRKTNEKPSYYLENYKRQTVEEFKILSVVGITTDGMFGVLETNVPWIDASGGQIKQTLYTDVATYVRFGNSSNDSWGSWKKIADTEYVSSQITQTSNSITQKITDTKNNLQSQISQLANDINLRVQKGDVINQINVSTEGILIDGKKVHITGQTTIDNAVIKDAMIQSMTANKLTAGTIDANVITVKNINASNIVTGTLDASKATVTNIDASKITTGTLNAARIAAGSIDASKLAAGTITAASGVIGSLDASKITTGTLDAARVNVVNLTADSIKSGTLTSININGGNINIGGGKFTVDSNGLMSAVNATVTGSFSSSVKDDQGTWNASLSSGRIAMSKIGDASETGGQYVPIYEANISAGGIYTVMRRNNRPWNYVQMSAGAVGSNDTFISVTANESDSSALYPDKLVVRNHAIVDTDGLHLDDDIVIGSGGWRALKFQTIRYNGTDYPSITQKDGKAGILFGSGYMYLLCSNKVVNLAQVYWPTQIDSSGRVVNWVNPLK